MLIKQNAPLILASTSKIRKRILDEVGLEFEVVTPLFDEDEEKKDITLPAKELAMYLAEQKALSVCEKHQDSYIIGSDQVCEFDNQEISKSKNSDEAKSQLKAMSGNVHFQNNAVAIALNGNIIFRNFSQVKLQMRPISDAEVDNYVFIDQPWGCAGSYKYESLGKHLFEDVTGDYYAVLGLSIQPLLSFLHQEKIISIRDK